MDSDLPPPPRLEEKPPDDWRLPLLVAFLLGVGVLAGIFWLGRPGSESSLPPVPARLPPLSGETAAYVSQIEISAPDLSRWQNYLGQTITYLDSSLANHGSRTIVVLELSIEFHDGYQQVVLRETVRPIGAPQPTPANRRGAPLPPGQTRAFRASFEHIPADWNGAPPQMRITGLLLQ